MKSIAVASYSLSTSPALRAELEKRHPGVAIDWNTTAQVMAPESLVEFLKGHAHAILGRETLDAGMIKKLPELKVIGKYGVGLDCLDLEAMSKAGILLGWTPGVNRRAVAELALTFLLTAFRGVHLATPGLKQNHWTRPKGRQLSEKTIGLIGCGNVGRELALLLKGFQCRILAHDLRADEPEYREFFSAHGIQATDLKALLANSDAISLHVPKNASTIHLIDPAAIETMKPGAILINTARGGLVNERAALSALEKGHLGAAAFDVFEQEPSSNQALIAHPRFFGTPHIGGASDEAIHAMGMAAIEGLSSPVDPLSLKRYQ